MKRRHIDYGSCQFTFLKRNWPTSVNTRLPIPILSHLPLLKASGCEWILSLDDIEELQGYVAAEANHTKNAKLRSRLDRLFDKFKKFLDRYDDQE